MRHPTCVSADATLTENVATTLRLRGKKEKWDRREANLENQRTRINLIAFTLFTLSVAFLLAGGPLLGVLASSAVSGVVFTNLFRIVHTAGVEEKASRWNYRKQTNGTAIPYLFSTPIWLASDLTNHKPNIHPVDYTEAHTLLTNLWDTQQPYRATNTPFPENLAHTSQHVYDTIHRIITQAHERTLPAPQEQHTLRDAQTLQQTRTDILTRYLQEDTDRLRQHTTPT